jgi:A/G-specific adenine glycosylase
MREIDFQTKDIPQATGFALLRKRRMVNKDILNNPLDEPENLQQGLLAWFASNSRKLPWRVDYIPYQVWISEIMLQQTQVKTMLPFYHRWMARFPDIASLAQAPEDDVLRLWEGLGYYARARNIAKAARIMVSEHGGEVPSNFDVLRRLPGIGRYTAGAIMSIAFNADYPAADANAGRIFARLGDIPHPSGSKEFCDPVDHLASKLLPRGRSRAFNQALMDLGSMVCLAKEPSCDQCPISCCCIAFHKGLTALRPVKAKKKAPLQITRAAVVMVREGKVLIRKRPVTGLMAHLWELPGGEVPAGAPPEKTIGRIWLDELGIRLGPLENLGVIRHSHTAFRVELHAFLCNDPAPLPGVVENTGELKWIPIAELEKPAFPSAHRRIIRAFLERLLETF